MEKSITIIGAGYVGLSTAALLANVGYKVYLIDVNKKRLDTIRKGKSFFFEDGIDVLIKDAVTNKTLLPTDSYKKAIPQSSIIFSCVGTPDNPDGSSNLSYVFAAAEETANYVKPGSIYVQKSTVPVETGKEVIKSFKKAGLAINYVSNPEFLREGTAIADALWFDRVVCGSQNEQAKEAIFDLYRDLEKNRNKLMEKTSLKKPNNEGAGKYISTGLESAELIKVTANAFLAMKISFANSIAKLADSVSADVVEVMDAVGEDKRIGRAFLNAGRGYGGGCFPKDMSGLIDVMNEHGADSAMLTAAQDINASMPGYIVNKLQEKIGSLDKVTVAVLGLAFKPGTSDVRRSPGVAIANTLARLGAKVTAYDPIANGEAKDDLRRDITIGKTLKNTLSGAKVVVIATDWPEFMELSFESTKVNVVVDAMNVLKNPPKQINYIGVGRS
jgi:UDPglucose 6-dehydrogenase